MVNKTAMKKISLLLITLSFPVIIYAQNIDYAEYFIDSDPGYGMATPIAVTETGTDIAMDFSTDIAPISQGIHFLVIRVKDDLGRWSTGANSVFYHVKTADVSDRRINQAEYFIDTDPGYGMATQIAVPETGTDISLDFSADIAPISQGIHYLVIRARDDLGRWSTGANSVFYHVKTVDVSDRKIDQAEYFIDTDPGFGKAVSIPVSTPENELTLNFTANIQALAQGIHNIHFRVRDISGRWGTVAHGIFVNVKIPSSSESIIHQVEYFIDTDQGYGNGTQVTLPSAGSDLDIDFNISLTGLDNGNHVLYVRAKNGQNKWGQVFAEVFTFNPTGVDQEEINSLFKIYPNPGKENIQIELTDQIRNTFNIRIMDINGKLVYENECHNNPCELNLDLPGGVYLLTIETDERCLTQKIILE